MKTVSIRTPILFAAIVIAFSTYCHAHSPRAQELCGAVQEISAKKHELTFQSGSSKPVALVWTQSTSFIENKKISDIHHLRAGQPVCVFYHRPFFGKPFVVRVEW